MFVSCRGPYRYFIVILWTRVTAVTAPCTADQISQSQTADCFARTRPWAQWIKWDLDSIFWQVEGCFLGMEHTFCDRPQPRVCGRVTVVGGGEECCGNSGEMWPAPTRSHCAPHYPQLHFSTRTPLLHPPPGSQIPNKNTEINRKITIADFFAPCSVF